MQRPPESSKPTELSDAEREQLKQSLQVRSLDSKHLGYLAADAKNATKQCAVAHLPDKSDPVLGQVSVCGAKTMLIEEMRQFTTTDGSTKDVRCASVAVLEMTDSPVHVHASTQEHYIVLSGTGSFILGAGDDERVVDVRQGSVVLIPPGQPHGIVSNDPAIPLRAMLTFTPGLAPKGEPEFRDEEVVHTRASDRVREIQANAGT